MRSELLQALCALLLGSALSRSASAQVSVPVANAGFESPPIAAGTFATTSAPPGWEAYGAGVDFGFRTVGVLDPGGTTLYAAPPPEGENVGVVFLLDDPGDQSVFAGVEAGLQQTLTEPLSAGLRYTLRVRVGNIAVDTSPPHDQFQFTGFPGYRVELLAGGTPVASDAGPAPPEGAFAAFELDFAPGDAHPLLGQPLGIRLVNLNAAPGLEVNFDDVRLDAAVVPGVPALGGAGSAALVLALGALGALLAARR